MSFLIRIHNFYKYFSIRTPRSIWVRLCSTMSETPLKRQKEQLLHRYRRRWLYSFRHRQSRCYTCVSKNRFSFYPDYLPVCNEPCNFSLSKAVHILLGLKNLFISILYSYSKLFNLAEQLHQRD